MTCCLLAFSATQAHPPASVVADRTEVQILVKPKASMSDEALARILSSQGAGEQGRIPALNVRIIRVPKAAAERLITALQNHPDVEYAEPDFTAEAIATPNDPLFMNDQQWHLTMINAPAAWDISTGSSNVVVAVVDSGVNANHPDLAGKILSSGYDYVANDTNPMDENGHGTAVAGVVSPACNNDLGIAGVSWLSMILPVRVLNANGSGSYSAISSGITYAADKGARIINMSLGGTSSSKTLQAAVNYAWNKNCILVAASGNNGNNIAVYPAACSNVVAVAASDSLDGHPTWSSYGSYIDVAAPGVDIATLYGADQYAWWTGTSFSSPVTAGVFALMVSKKPELSNTQLVNLLLNNCDDIGIAGYDTYFGNGRVNADRAVAAVANLETMAPVATITSPMNGSKVNSRRQNIYVTSSDNVAVTKVDLYIDSKLFGSSSTASASFTWNTSKITMGAHTLQAYAYDSAGNVGKSAIYTVYR
jgi:subtilisin family serine protease